MKPTTVCLWVAGVWLAIGLTASYFEAIQWVWEYYGIAFAAALLVDFSLARNSRHFVVERDVNTNLPVGIWSNVRLIVQNHNAWPVRVAVFDHYPDTAETRDQPNRVNIPAGKKAGMEYAIKPLVRGNKYFRGTELEITSLMGLWHLRHFCKAETEVKVYPNFAAISRYALLAADNRLSQLGVKRRQRRGEGMEFNQLREYRSGDSLRRIDWKATVRHGKMISREYEDERDQQVVFLLDCGRRMRVIEEGQAHLDLTLNAMLLLAYVAFRQGDSVGFLAFGGQDRWVAPRKGANMMNYLLNQCYTLDSTTRPADYLETANRLMQLQSRRSMVVILSNTRGEEDSDLARAIKLLRTKHLVVLADIREPGLQEQLEESVGDLDSAIAYQSIVGYLQRRREIHENLSHIGALCVDSSAPELPLRLVNKYLEIKDAGRL